MKKKELILKRPQDFKLHKTSDPKDLLNKYLVKKLYRTWNEDFTDSDTGEVVSIERKELIADVGQIDQDVLQCITFALQAGDIKEVEYCCHQVGNAHFFNAGRTFFVEFVQDYELHKKCLVFAKGVEQALQIISDYLSVNQGCCSSLEAAGIKVIFALFINDNDECIPEKEQQGATEIKDYYKVNVKFNSFELGDYSKDYIITADEVGMAKSRVERYINNNAYDKEHLHFNVKKAMPFDVDFVVPREYCQMYWDEKD